MRKMGGSPKKSTHFWSRNYIRKIFLKLRRKNARSHWKIKVGQKFLRRFWTVSKILRSKFPEFRTRKFWIRAQMRPNMAKIPRNPPKIPKSPKNPNSNLTRRKSPRVGARADPPFLTMWRKQTKSAQILAAILENRSESTNRRFSWKCPKKGRENPENRDGIKRGSQFR